ncbi:hypothetical protein [Prochlorothrix hollandica]|uniref:Uncharacterized protein n=1 Tax=Prochlorothrix hollandica PCC 9006 = CALU 1027 TaxID=317619 RepID=A0A0M2Q1U7_PROHO|nr:hypothetical protein [Prochlorothrix hollandica]KKJ01273.1 hypothetical protein PROH_02600 [Prochlorothrix hollandica PCC 9006 = CALU 1027]
MYLVTTHPHRLPSDHQIIMVDGTVPQWQPRPYDLHWDHHRSGGAPIQVAEMPLPQATTLLQERGGPLPPCFTTTQVDADACVAAAWVQLPRSVLQQFPIVQQLQAIAWDCDHLRVPPELDPWGEFALKVVASLKVQEKTVREALELPPDRKQWQDQDRERFSSAAFEAGTQWLIAAALGQRSWPGEVGEAEAYWQQLQRDCDQLRQDHRVQLLPSGQGLFAVCDLRGIDRYIDPRGFYQVLAEIATPEQLRPETLTWRDRPQGGWSYTLGSIPLHPRQGALDFTQGTFDRLTQAEQAKSGQPDPWGGRSTVGGSPWNAASVLTPGEILAVLGD